MALCFPRLNGGQSLSRCSGVLARSGAKRFILLHSPVLTRLCGGTQSLNILVYGKAQKHASIGLDPDDANKSGAQTSRTSVFLSVSGGCDVSHASGNSFLLHLNGVEDA